jgi:hypothetical protein
MVTSFYAHTSWLKWFKHGLTLNKLALMHNLKHSILPNTISWKIWKCKLGRVEHHKGVKTTAKNATFKYPYVQYVQAS